MKLGITMLMHNKDDNKFVTEFPCFLGHPVPRVLYLEYTTWITILGVYYLKDYTWSILPGVLNLEYITWSTKHGEYYLEYYT